MKDFYFKIKVRMLTYGTLVVMLTHTVRLHSDYALHKLSTRILTFPYCFLIIAAVVSSNVSTVIVQ